MGAIKEEIGFGGRSNQDSDLDPTLQKIKEIREETSRYIHDPPAEKISNYPKYLSYEGSMVICVLLSMKDIVRPSISNLPAVDQMLLKTLVPDEDFLNDIEVRFDENKDFVFVFKPGTSKAISFVMFNSVAHPRPEDLKDFSEGIVPVKKEGEKISIGGRISLDTKGIKKMIGVEPVQREKRVEIEEERSSFNKRQPVSGRNAYEIRDAILDKAIDIIRINGDYKNLSVNDIVDKILDISSKLYNFVENKNR
jgi:hypothetical protein